VVVRGPGALVGEGPRVQQRHRIAQLPQQHGERAIELVAEAASPSLDQLVDEGLLGQLDLFAKVDGEVLEGNRTQVGPVQPGEGPPVRDRGPGGPDAPQIGVHYVHAPIVPP
jgi:hypothetical protein